MALQVPYVPVEAKPLRLRMGLRPLDLREWLEVDHKRPSELAQKQGLLDSPLTRPLVTACLPGRDAAGQELFRLVVDHMHAFHPGLVVPAGDGQYRDTSTGHVVDGRGLQPLEAAARLVQEDLCLMVRSGAEWTLAAAVVCFPSRWRLTDKIGASLRGIHSPVPGYDAELAGPTQAFFERLSEDHPMWRLNWTLIGDPELHQPDPADRIAARRADLIDAGREVWFRVERQTLRKLAGDEIVFTIRTYVAPLADVVASNSDVGTSLQVALSGLDPDLCAYKGWGRIAPQVISWLAERPDLS